MNSPKLQGKQILIVDDDQDISGAIDLAMRAEGATTTTAADGTAAMAAAADGPDAIVLDMMLPRQSGFVVLERIKQQPNPPVIVMITANEGKRHQEYADTLGVDAYLTKPVPLDRLVDTVAELLSGGTSHGSTETKA